MICSYDHNKNLYVMHLKQTDLDLIVHALQALSEKTTDNKTLKDLRLDISILKSLTALEANNYA
jgi:hypothetical protein